MCVCSEMFLILQHVHNFVYEKSLGTNWFLELLGGGIISRLKLLRSGLDKGLMIYLRIRN